jgi:hypothetical protein
MVKFATPSVGPTYPFTWRWERRAGSWRATDDVPVRPRADVLWLTGPV